MPCQRFCDMRMGQPWRAQFEALDRIECISLIRLAQTGTPVDLEPNCNKEMPAALVQLEVILFTRTQSQISVENTLG